VADTSPLRAFVKGAARAAATATMLPALCSYWLRARLLGADRALEGSTQALALLPGLPGQYLRRAFLRHTLEYCDASAVVEFGTIFASTATRIERDAYIGPRCHLGSAQIGAGALVAAGVHIPSGAHIHGTADSTRPVREQPGERRRVSIGPGAWIGSAAIVMADVGPHTVVGAGAVVTRPLPGHVVAAGVPARVVKPRGATESKSA
jgi:acetyltransferase-like isoleucine patch superfamily enzyme